MSKFIEKIAAVEEQIVLIQSKIVPLASKVDALDQKIQGFTKLLTDIADDTAAVRQEIDSAQSGFESIQALLNETKTEGEQFSIGQEENKQLHDSLTTMFGEAFQVVSRFFETAQKFGIVDKEKVSSLLALNPSAIQPAVEPTVESELTSVDLASLPIVALSEAGIYEPVIESVPDPTLLSESAGEPIIDTLPPLPPLSETETSEPVGEPIVDTLPPLPFPETQPAESVGESVGEIVESLFPPPLPEPEISAPISVPISVPISESISESIVEPQSTDSVGDSVGDSIDESVGSLPPLSELVITEPVVTAELSEAVAEVPEPVNFPSSFNDESAFDELPKAESVPEIAKLTLPNISAAPPTFGETPLKDDINAAADLAIEQLTESGDALHLPPLAFSEPAEIDELSADEEKELEDLLTGLSKPITT